jgi:Asp-tRNA(Asn)/Glu-tRNA(Gln) amidotransferase A subunit family amidase
MQVVEKSIQDLREALQSGQTTSANLVTAYLARIKAYDRQGICLNAVPILSPDALADAQASDERRARGQTLGPLDGIPYTAKDSYRAKGLTVAAGLARLRGYRRSGRRLRHRTVAQGRGDTPWPHQHAANGKRRHAARPLWPC